jgi:hypothetical protein
MRRAAHGMHRARNTPSLRARAAAMAPPSASAGPSAAHAAGAWRPRKTPCRNAQAPSAPADSTPNSTDRTASYARAGAACSGTQNIALDADAVTISDGPHAYANNAACRWAVTAAGPISLFVHSFETEEGYDTVTVYAGDDASQPPLYTLSGVLGPVLFATNATSVTIEFGSDGDRRFAGFVIELSTVQPGGTWAPSRASSAAPTWAAGTGALMPLLAAVGRNGHCDRPLGCRA